jgi:hypothetical protein
VKITRRWLRSAQGQLALLGGAYLGAVALAVVALGLRSAFFERNVGEAYRPAPEPLMTLLKATAAGKATPEQLRSLEEAKANLVYDAWMSEADLDPQGRLARRLLSWHGRLMLERVRRTLALGTAAQRARALDLLGWAGEAELRPEVVRLCRYELRRARRRGEEDLAGRAADLLARLKANE